MGDIANNKDHERNKRGQAIPENWTNASIVYVYKNKGGPGECGNYGPICLTGIIYMVGSGLIERKLTKITHILTRNNPFGYKEGVSTIDAIIKIEEYIEHANSDAEILLMGISEDFDTINRTLLWATLYKKGLPLEMTKHTRRGHQGTKLAPNTKGSIGIQPETISGYFKDPQSVRCYS